MLIAKSESRETRSTSGPSATCGMLAKGLGQSWCGGTTFHRTNGLVFFSCHVCQNHLRRRVSAGCWHTLNTSLIFSNFPLNQRNHRDGRCSGGRPPGTETRVGWVPRVHSCGISGWKNGRGSRDGCWWWVLRVARATELTGVELGRGAAR